ncbi:unnamed protein product [Trichobilharzia szidati]|nr:unnamed protein product [Trichobilharzia szidati]CAH8864459.1 unnamed protein product [Trichobilharzia szidati]
MDRLLLAKKCAKIIAPVCREMAYYHIEWKPKPFPCTKAEREAAAKRYNLLPSDYKPFEDDGLAPGDYFKVEPYNVNNLDPWEPYDYPRSRRNYNDPVLFKAHMYSSTGYDPVLLKERLGGHSIPWVLFKTFSPLFVLTFLLYIGQMFGYFSPLKAKQFPLAEDRDNHYTFERPE